MWFQDVAKTYPEETTRFLQNRADRFANPVGHAVRRGLEGVLDSLVAGAEREEIASHLDEIVRIRAVQQFSPSGALSFIFSLKDIVRRVCAAERSAEAEAELKEFDSRIDRLALLAFDNYMECRETLFEIKVKELKDLVAIQTRNMWKSAAAEGGGEAPNKEPAGGQ
jgi:hypothetical protein